MARVVKFPMSAALNHMRGEGTSTDLRLRLPNLVESEGVRRSARIVTMAPPLLALIWTPVISMVCISHALVWTLYRHSCLYVTRQYSTCRGVSVLFCFVLRPLTDSDCSVHVFQKA